MGWNPLMEKNKFMQQNAVRLLSVEDNPGDARLLVELIRGIDTGGAVRIKELVSVKTLSEALQMQTSQAFDLVLLDLSLPDSSGLDTVRQMLQAAPRLPIVVMSGIQDELMGVQAVQAGAQDYLTKGDVDSRGLARSIRYAVERMQSQIALQEERNRAQAYEEEARLYSQKNEEAMEISRMAAWDFDFGTQTIEFSQRFADLHGITGANGFEMPAEDFVGKYVHPSYSARVRSIFFGAAHDSQKSQANQVQCQMMRSNGERFWVSIWFRMEAGANGSPRTLHGVNQDITQLKQAELALQASEQYLVTAQRLAHIGYWEHDFIHPQTIWSDEACRILGLSNLNKNRRLEDVWKSVHPDDIHKVVLPWKDTVQNQERHYATNCRMLLPEGGTRSIQMQGDIEYENGQPARLIGAIQDVSEHILAQEKLQLALEEKLVLLREVHHRVKNNLQAIISLIEMRIDQMIDPYTIQFLREIQEQARTMSLVYEQLYQSDNLARVEMQTYLDKLTNNVIHAFGEGRFVLVDVQASGVWLEVGAATPCGLIVNELVTNSLKHAFPEDFAGQPAIQVSIHLQGEHFHLSVTDNGVGLPDNVELRQTRSMGLRLVKLWAVHQLGGEFTVNSENGTRYLITFDEMRKSIKKNKSHAES